MTGSALREKKDSSLAKAQGDGAAVSQRKRREIPLYAGRPSPGGEGKKKSARSVRNDNGWGWRSLLTTHSLSPLATMNSMRLRIFCFALLFLLPAAAPAQTADEILAKELAARGGVDKLRAIHSECVSGQISFGDFTGPLLDYKSKGNQIELVGKDKVDDKDVWRLKLTTKNGDARFYLFDANSFLLLKWEGKRKYQDQELPVESHFSDYREVGGVKFAFAIDSGSSAADLTQKIRIEKVELNPDLNDTEFGKPSAPPQPAAPAAPPP